MFRCWQLYTTERVARLVRDNIDKSPLFNGQIEGIGPRYCPSLEDKIVRFPEKERHQIFLEPEGLTTKEIYPNGISTSLPFDVQLALVRSIRGLENAHLVRPGYAIEYDAVDPRELTHSLELKSIQSLFLAGQINGTSGYEEAACQGLIAGINAACLVGGKDPLVVSRTDGYTGILISDLVSKGADEPYRMFTSRAEFRLHLRIDNADERLTPLGRKFGLVDDRRWDLFQRKQEQKQRLRAYFSAMPQQAAFLRRPEVKIGEMGLDPDFGRDVLTTVETEIKYAGYIAQQHRQVAQLRESERRAIPETFAYQDIPGLSREVCEKLQKVRPATLGQAGKIPGITPAAMAILDVYLSLNRPNGRL